MKWCIFVNRRCYSEDCMGWVEGTCFVHKLLPGARSDAPEQAELDWSYESLGKGESLSEHQLTFLDELEKLIAEKKV